MTFDGLKTTPLDMMNDVPSLTARQCLLQHVEVMRANVGQQLAAAQKRYKDDYKQSLKAHLTLHLDKMCILTEFHVRHARPSTLTKWVVKRTTSWWYVQFGKFRILEVQSLTNAVDEDGTPNRFSIDLKGLVQRGPDGKPWRDTATTLSQA